MLQPCYRLYGPRLVGRGGAILTFARPRGSDISSLQRLTWRGQSTSSHSSTDTLKEEVNPPINTLPPPLDLPKREPNTSYPVHLFRTGRAYGRFYWKGLNLVWSNHKDARTLRVGFQNLHQWASSKHPDFTKLRDSAVDLSMLAMAAEALQGRKGKLKASSNAAEEAFLSSPVECTTVTRARFQTLTRDEEDWSKLPKFGLLFLVCGEYLPLLVPFMPGLVPRTCRIPKQMDGMRKSREERRASSLKAGFEPLSRELVDAATATAQSAAEKKPALAFIDKHTWGKMMLAEAISERLTSRQLLHASTLLDLHSRYWGKVGISPPNGVLKRRVKRRLQYLAIDDRLLLKSKGAVRALSDAEVQIACNERGMIVTDKTDSDLREALENWLAKVESENIMAYFTTLFD